MNAIVFDIKHFAIHDGPGIRSSIFLKGCPLSCWWCHNPESRAKGAQKLDFDFKGSRSLGWETSAEELLEAVEKDRMFYEESGGGVTFTGGEPLLQADFLVEAAQLFKAADLHLTLDTTGYASSKVFQKAVQWIDLVLFDLKMMDEQKHFKYTGVSNKPILENLEYLVSQNKEVYIRFPMIPGINDDQENLTNMCEYLLKFQTIQRIHLLPYHKIAAGKYHQLGFENKMDGIGEPNDAKVQKVKTIIESYGFQVVIG